MDRVKEAPLELTSPFLILVTKKGAVLGQSFFKLLD